MPNPLSKSTQLIGMLSAIFASVFFSATDVIIKFLSDTYALHQILLVRSALGIIGIVAILWVTQNSVQKLKTHHLPRHLIRGLSYVIANMLFFMGLVAMPLADAVAIFFISPSIIALFSIVFLKEHVSIHRWLAIALGFIGVIVMVKPGSDQFVTASLFPLGSAVFYALLHTLTRTMRATESASTMTFYIQLCFVIMSVFMWLVAGEGQYQDASNPSLNFLLRPWEQVDLSDLYLLITLGLVSTLAGYLISQAYRSAESALVAPFEYIALPLAMVWGIVVFGEWPSLTTLIGSGFILASAFYTLYQESRPIRLAT